MADTFTTNLVLTLPEIGSSESTWGTKLNTNLTTIDNLFTAGPALAVASGGTGATTAAQGRSNLGLGTMATQDASAVTITGGNATLGASVFSGSPATVVIKDPTAGTDAKGYQFKVGSGIFQLNLLTDAGASANSVMQVTRGGTAPTSILMYAPLYVSGYLVYHTNNISSAPIQEAQIVDAAVFPRLASAETVTGQWSFSTIPQKTSGGKFLHYASTSYVGGAVTVSTSDPSGTPATGDRWVKYVP